MRHLLLILILALSVSCCKNDDDNTPTNPLDQLPPATQTGANTGGALVNGEAFLPNNQSVQPLVCHYLDQQDFTLGISKKVNDIYYIILISIYNTQLEIDHTYSLNTEFGIAASSGEYSINNESYPSTNYYSTNSENYYPLITA